MNNHITREQLQELAINLRDTATRSGAFKTHRGAQTVSIEVQDRDHAMSELMAALDQILAEAELLRQCNKACEALPLNYCITITLEKNSGSVDLISYPAGMKKHTAGYQDLAEAVGSAIDIATSITAPTPGDKDE